MQKLIKLLFVMSFPLFFIGCAHKMSIAPKTDEISSIEPHNKLNVNVGYYISQEDRIKSIIGPGGGGDKVEYAPYADTESAFRLVLSKIFSKVYYIDSLENKKIIEDRKIKYVFVPSIYTTSYSDGLFTWPPTKFTYELRCYATNNEGKEIWSDIVYSEGYATFNEFKNNFGLAGQKASEETFIKLLKQIDKSGKFN